MAVKLRLAVLLGGLLVQSAAAASCEQPFSPFVVVDQFGYQPAMRKIAVIRSPVTGFDAARKFAPGKLYQVVESQSCKVVYEGTLTPWNKGATDPSSGDRAWHFDFSAVTAPGQYVIRDRDKQVVSGVFAIAANPYREVLVQAVRFFYYQRANTPKAVPYADPRWADGADHIGPRQDKAARHLMKKDDPSSERDLTGGWWDAGDFNRYTNWHSDYIISLLASYRENPAVFTDDFNIPESGNGIPDLIDEVKWGADWLIKMQNPDGSVLSILHSGMVGAPPSSATNPSYYGSPSTSATYSAAGAFAAAAKSLAGFAPYKAYAAELGQRAKRAYAWAEAHPDVTFFNKAPAYGDQTLGGGEQEYAEKERPTRALIAAIHLYDLTGDEAYQARIASLVGALPLIEYSYFGSPDAVWLQPLLYYTTLKGARRALAAEIGAKFAAAFRSEAIYGGEAAGKNPYLAYLPVYFWGSTKEISRQGFFFLKPKLDGIAGAPAGSERYAADYLHYLHGVNPLAKVYLSNMGAFGAENSVDEFYHAWFAKGSPWQNVKTSPMGPPPGFLVGGPNPSYDWEKACPGLDPRCGSARLTPPYAQPPQKSYADFSDSYPIDSWQVTEPSAGYQVEYIRLLAHFVSAPQPR